MKLTSMKITRAEREKRNKPIEASYPGMDGDSYPYGLQIRLDDTALEKLGIKNLPKTGRKVRVTCECMVTSTSEHKRSSGGKDDRNRSMELQIEKLAVNLEASSATEAVDDALKDA
jgi:hypothetical protein